MGVGGGGGVSPKFSALRPKLEKFFGPKARKKGSFDLNFLINFPQVSLKCKGNSMGNNNKSQNFPPAAGQKKGK